VNDWNFSERMIELTRDHDLDDAWEIVVAEMYVEADRLRQLPMRDPHTKAAIVETYRRAQGNRCAICGVSGDDKPLVLDHDGAHGARWCNKCVRGLLCPKCNSALGMFNDDVGLLARAVGYIQNAKVTT
jgi:Recombination endonuclease VII